MNYIKRAFYSISRRKGKTLILFIIVLILGNLIAGAISIRQATTQVESATRKQLGSTATIAPDYNKLMEQTDMSAKLENLDKDLIEKFGKSSSVNYYDYNLKSYLNSTTLKPCTSDSENSGMITSDAPFFTVKGVQYAPILDIKEKKNKLIEGRVFDESDIKDGKQVAVISKKLAETNDLNIGDTVVLQNNVYEHMGMNGDSSDNPPLASRDLPLEIIGIFEPIEYEKKDNSGQQGGMADFLKMDELNTIYTPNLVTANEFEFMSETLTKASPDSDPIENFYEPTYVLKTPDSIKAFVDEVTPQLPKDYKLSTSSDQYDTIAAPIKSMNSISNIVLAISIFASLIIISLIVVLFLRDRKHEFGIYLSLGEKKRKVLGQVIVEVIAISFLGITLSLFTGNFLARNVSKTMIQNQITQAAEAKSKEQSGGAALMISGNNNQQNNLTTDEVVDAYDISFDISYILIFYVIGLGTVLVSTVAPMAYLMRLNPKKILL